MTKAKLIIVCCSSSKASLKAEIYNFHSISSFLKIAEWLSDSKMPAVCLKIDEDQRPVKLRKIVLGFPCSNNQTEFKFDLTLNYKIATIIQAYSEQKPALVVQQFFWVFLSHLKLFLS